ncbi:hypothetical protein KIN20_028890 [Parelaphostrongylus tenuis]|uniref:Uncharacterized protein n=1 Tax=Parelaphostrongylus tenuis TaxID=148309 RepID=A0AAD5WF20_PARTN|nr:hypothetical protein KIN20_028890 [Parelaphostrongylus tenuis]
MDEPMLDQKFRSPKSTFFNQCFFVLVQNETGASDSRMMRRQAALRGIRTLRFHKRQREDTQRVDVFFYKMAAAGTGYFIQTALQDFTVLTVIVLPTVLSPIGIP